MAWISRIQALEEKFQHDNRRKAPKSKILKMDIYLEGNTCSKPLLCVSMLVFEGVIRLISWNRQDQRIDHMTIMATASRCRNFAHGTYLFYLACFVGVLLTCIMWLLSKNYLLRWCHTLHGLRWVTQTLDASGSLYLFTHGRFLRFWIWQSTSADDHLVGKALIYHLTTYPRNMRYFSMFILQQELIQIVRFTSPGEAYNINTNVQVLMSHTNWHFCAGPKYPIITHYNKLYMRFLD